MCVIVLGPRVLLILLLNITCEFPNGVQKNIAVAFDIPSGNRIRVYLHKSFRKDKSSKFKIRVLAGTLAGGANQGV